MIAIEIGEFMYFLIYVLPAILVSVIGYYWTHNEKINNKVTMKEFAISVVLNIAIAAFGVGVNELYIGSQFSDVYYKTGVVTDKKSVKVDCEHSYRCNCYTTCSGSGSNRSCTEHCSTCYDHSFDIDWVVISNIGSVDISREDRQGLKEPKRWSNVKIGEPFTIAASWDNYLLADPSSLFVVDTKPAPISHPSVYDYYRFNHVQGGESWLKDAVSEWAANKRIQPLVFVTSSTSEDYYYSVMSALKGGKRNTVVFVYGVADGVVNWMRVGTYASGYKNKLMESTVENATLDKPNFSKELVLTQLNTANNMFVQVDSDEFKDKRDMVDIPAWLSTVILLLNFLVSIWFHIFARKNHI